jgi:hypothetical protein
LTKLHSNFKFQEEILLNSKPRNFSDFPFGIHLESKKVPTEKVVSFFKSFKPIFYSKFLELEKVLFGSKEDWTSFKFEFNIVWMILTQLTGFKPGTVAGAHLSASASPVLMASPLPRIARRRWLLYRASLLRLR